MKLEIKRRRPRIELVPMIDVMFFMLVFFMLFSTLKGAQSGVPVDLPKALHLGKTEQNTVIISIDKHSQLFYGKQTVSLDGLKDEIRREIASDADTQVVIRPDAAVPYSRVVRVMDALAGAGVQKPLLGVDRQQMPNSNRPQVE